MMSPLARLKDVFSRRPEEREADISQNKIGDGSPQWKLLLVGAAARAGVTVCRLNIDTNADHVVPTRQRISRQRRERVFDVHPCLAGSSCSTSGPLALGFYVLLLLSSSDWALCLSRKVLASFCLKPS